MKELEVVGAVIHDDQSGYLCALRSKEMSQGGFWEFPGGKVEQGEEPKEALKREIKEELGCAIEVGKHIATTIHDYPQVRVKLHTYHATLWKGTPVAKEHEELRWVSREGLTRLEWAPADIPTVDKLLSL